MRAVCARSILTATVALSCAVLAGAPSAGAATGALLRYSYTLGQQIPYQMTLDLSGVIPGYQSKVALGEKVLYTQQVKTVYPDGSALLVDTFSSATVTLNGQSTTTPLTTAAVSEHVTVQGKVISTKVTGVQNSLGGALNLDPTSGAPSLPASPVVVGSHWTYSQHVSLGSLGAVNGALHYKVLALGPVNGHTMATIQATGTLPLTINEGGTQASGTAAGTNAIQFDVDQGALISSHATMKVHASLGTGAGAGQSTPITLMLQLNIDRRSSP